MFRSLALARDTCHFDWDEKCAIVFWNDYDNGALSLKSTNIVKLEMLNDNFTETETEINKIIESSKNNTCPGLDSIPSEFIKSCKHELVDIITLVLNHIIEGRDFPDREAEVLRTNVLDDIENYRGIVVLFAFAKIVETAVNDPIVFASEPFERITNPVVVSFKEAEPLPTNSLF